MNDRAEEKKLRECARALCTIVEPNILILKRPPIWTPIQVEASFLLIKELITEHDFQYMILDVSESARTTAKNREIAQKYIPYLEGTFDYLFVAVKNPIYRVGFRFMVQSMKFDCTIVTVKTVDEALERILKLDEV